MENGLFPVLAASPFIVYIACGPDVAITFVYRCNDPRYMDNIIPIQDPAPITQFEAMSFEGPCMVRATFPRPMCGNSEVACSLHEFRQECILTAWRNRDFFVVVLSQWNIHRLCHALLFQVATKEKSGCRL